MAFVDVFTGVAGTDLSTHSPTGGAGGPWAKHTDIAGGTGVLQFDTAGTALVALSASNTTNQALYQATGFIPGSGDWEAVCGWRCKSIVALATPLVGLRVGTGASQRNGYWLRGNVAADGGTTWQLYKSDIAAGLTLVGSYAEPAPGGWVVGNIRPATVKAVGAVVTMILDGVERISYTDPSPITRAGVPSLMGISSQSQTTGYHFASITVNDLTPLTPVNTVAPKLSITGVPRVGAIVSCSQGTWTNAVSYAYQWKRDGSNIGGATSSTYILQAADLDTLVTCTVTASNPDGNTAVVSNPVQPRAASRIPGVAREALIPDEQRTLLLVGDTHIGNIPTYRWEKFRDNVNRTGTWQPRTVATVHVGDMVEGEDGVPDPPTYPEQDAIALPWLASFNDTPMIVMEGNHDSGTRAVGPPRTTEEWETAFGVLANDYVDLPHFRFIKVGYQSFNSNAKQFAKDTINAAGRPCILGIHFPMRDTVGGGVAPHDNLTTTKSPTFGLCLSAGDNAGMLEVIAECPDLKAIVTGHCHAWFDTEDFVMRKVSGANAVAHVNAGALMYSGSGPDERSDPIIGYYVTLNEDESSVSVRMRDHGAQMWKRWPDHSAARTIENV